MFPKRKIKATTKKLRDSSKFIRKQTKNALRRIYVNFKDRLSPYRPLSPAQLRQPIDLDIFEKEFATFLFQNNPSYKPETASSFIANIPTHTSTLTGTTWCITTYFNPNKTILKKLNYDVFANQLRAQEGQLLTVELSFSNDDFQLRETDADVLVQVRGESILWQKERLLNIALRKLPEDCDKVIWLDADIVFNDNDWLTDTAKLLEKYYLIQPFSFRFGLPKNNRSTNLSFPFPVARDCRLEPGFMYSHVTNNGDKPVWNNQFSYPNPGCAWAARKSIIQKLGFYDRMIIGTGDTIMTRAFLGHHNYSELAQVSENLRKDILRYTQKASSLVNGSVGYRNGLVIHLWHGAYFNRHYSKRLRILQEHEFNPQTDIKISETGAWKWASDKPLFHAALKNYFQARKE